MAPAVETCGYLSRETGPDGFASQCSEAEYVHNDSSTLLLALLLAEGIYFIAVMLIDRWNQKQFV